MDERSIRALKRIGEFPYRRLIEDLKLGKELGIKVVEISPQRCLYYM